MRTTEAENFTITVVVIQDSDLADAGLWRPMRHAKRRRYKRGGPTVEEENLFGTDEWVGNVCNARLRKNLHTTYRD